MDLLAVCHLIIMVSYFSSVLMPLRNISHDQVSSQFQSCTILSEIHTPRMTTRSSWSLFSSSDVAVASLLPRTSQLSTLECPVSSVLQAGWLSLLKLEGSLVPRSHGYPLPKPVSYAFSCVLGALSCTLISWFPMRPVLLQG